VADIKCSCLSVLLVYATQRTANCVALAILIGTYQLVNDICARRGNACIRIRSVTQQSSRRELHLGTESHTVLVRSRVQLQTVSAGTGSCGVLLPLKPMLIGRLFSLCGDLTARERNSTKVSLWRRYF